MIYVCYEVRNLGCLILSNRRFWIFSFPQGFSDSSIERSFPIQCGELRCTGAMSHDVSLCHRFIMILCDAWFNHYLARLRIWICIFDITMRNFGYVGFLFKSCEQLLVFRLLSLLVDQKRLEFARPYDCAFLLDVRLEKYLACAYDLWGKNFVSTDEVSLLEIYVTKADTWACTQP